MNVSTHSVNEDGLLPKQKAGRFLLIELTEGITVGEVSTAKMAKAFRRSLTIEEVEPFQIEAPELEARAKAKGKAKAPKPLEETSEAPTISEETARGLFGETQPTNVVNAE